MIRREAPSLRVIGMPAQPAKAHVAGSTTLLKGGGPLQEHPLSSMASSVAPTTAPAISMSFWHCVAALAQQWASAALRGHRAPRVHRLSARLAISACSWRITPTSDVARPAAETSISVTAFDTQKRIRYCVRKLVGLAGRQAASVACGCTG